MLLCPYTHLLCNVLLSPQAPQLRMAMRLDVNVDASTDRALHHRQHTAPHHRLEHGLLLLLLLSVFKSAANTSESMSDAWESPSSRLFSPSDLLVAPTPLHGTPLLSGADRHLRVFFLSELYAVASLYFHPSIMCSLTLFSLRQGMMGFFLC